METGMKSLKSPAEIVAEKQKVERLNSSLGCFIFEFSQLEFMIRSALGDALGLDNDRFDVIISPYDFAALCRTTAAFFSRFMNCNKVDQIKIQDLMNQCKAANDDRNKIVHGTWFIDESGHGVRHVSRQQLNPEVYYKNIDELDYATKQIRRLKSELWEFLSDPQPATNV